MPALPNARPRRPTTVIETIPLTPVPSPATLARARRPSPNRTAAHALTASFTVLASCSLPERLRRLDATWCGPHNVRVECWAYLDCDNFRPAQPLAAVKLVGHASYRLAHHAPLPSCCDRRVDYMDARQWDGRGPSNFYCDTHRAVTKRAQYRYLPALLHTMQRRPPADWLVMTDDDTWVNVPRLFEVLARYDHEMPLQLGEFVSGGERYNATHWRRPYACGGAGTVLSRGAARRMARGLPACVASLNGSCLQSDWMIGDCAARAGVVAVTELACGLCASHVLGSTAGGGRASNAVSSAVMAARLLRCEFAQAPLYDQKWSGAMGPRAQPLPHQLFGVSRSSLSVLYLLGAAVVHADARWFSGGPLLHRSKVQTRYVDPWAHCSRDRGAEWSAQALRSMPGTMIIGAQKAATTSLWTWLMSHQGANGRGFCPSYPAGTASDRVGGNKEKHFWDSRACDKGLAAYQALFDNRTRALSPRQLRHCRRAYPGAKCELHCSERDQFIDATPLLSSGYPAAILAASRVFYSLPPPARAASPRLIAIVREPTQRAASFYGHMVARAAECAQGCHQWMCSVVFQCHRADPQQGPEPFLVVPQPIPTFPGRLIVCAPAYDTDQVRCYSGLPTNGTMSFELWCALHGFYALPYGIYAPQLRQWRGYFGDGLLVLSYDELAGPRDAAASALRRVSAHVGLRPADAPALRARELNQWKVTNANSRRKCQEVDCDLQLQLYNYFAPHNELLYEDEPQLPRFVLGRCARLEPESVGKLYGAFTPGGARTFRGGGVVEARMPTELFLRVKRTGEQPDVSGFAGRRKQRRKRERQTGSSSRGRRARGVYLLRKREKVSKS